MEKLIEALEEYNEILKAFDKMLKPMIKTSEKAVESLKLIMEQYDKS